jgi:hypothetical protein
MRKHFRKYPRNKWIWPRFHPRIKELDKYKIGKHKHELATKLRL